MPKNFTFTSLILCSMCVLMVLCVSTPSLAGAVSKNVQVPSKYDFETVREKALAFLKEHKLTVFAEFDHGKNAKGVNLSLPATTVIVFGNPVVGTKLMQQFPGIGMALPLKILITEDTDGKGIVTYQNLADIFGHYQVPKENLILKKMQALLEKLAQAATR